MRLNLRSRLFVGAAGLALAACTNFSQVYHFQTAARSGEVPNFFRVKVEGSAQTAKARFLAGFYDERAVDLYFNETKSTTDGELRKLFPDGLKAPGEAAALTPLTPELGRGNFVMIFSTNPKAVADTIGNFADQQLVADAITNLVNRRDVDAARVLTATSGTDDQAANALAEELLALLPADGSSEAPAALERRYRRALEAISRHVGGPQSFADFAAAGAWLGRGTKGKP